MSWTKNNEWLTADGDHRVRWRELRRLVVYYRPFRGSLALAAVLALLGSVTAFLIPFFFYQLQLAIVSRSLPPLALALLGYLAILLVETATTYGIRVIRSRIATRLNRQLVLSYYGKLLNVAVEDFIAFRQRTNLFQRIVDAMSITPQFTDVLARGGQSVIVILVVGTVIGMVSAEVLLVLGVGAALLFTYALLRARELRDLRARMLALNFPLVGKMMEVVTGLFTIKSLSASLPVTRDVAALVNAKTDAEYAESRAESGVLQFGQAIRQATLVFAMAQGIVLLMSGRIDYAELISLYMLAGLFLQPVAELATLYQSLSRLSVNVANFYEVLDLPDEASQAQVAAESHVRGRAERVEALTAAGASAVALATGGGGQGVAPQTSRLGEAARVVVPPGSRGGHIVFRDVEFAYRDGSPVLTGVDMEIFPGEKVSLIGRSGAGKTTLFRLLLGFLQPQRGSMLLDGEDVATHPDKNAYRRHFGVVGQHDVLFGVSIRENLVFGLEETVPTERIEQALRMVALWSDVERLPDGLDAIYSEDRFSGGQRQRLFIARALLRRPRVVLLDEPTSALDFQSEGQVIEAIDHLVGGKTTVTIAHRLSTVRNADRVIVLDGGKICGIGPHDELYRSNSYYRSLCDYNSFVV
jgi:ABC-type multidrug transport system fused ATPase/permease subunit